MNYIFDLLGTLIAENPSEYIRIMSESFGLDNQGYKERVRYFLSTNDFPSAKDALDSLLSHLKISFNENQRQSFFSKLDNWKNSLQLYDGALEVMAKARSRGAKTAIISNNNKLIEDVIEKFHLDQYADCIVLSHKVGCVKPSEEIYKIALRSSIINPADAIMIGDQIDKDVLIPISLGMRGVLFDSEGKYADYRGEKITSLRELIN